MSIDNLPLLQAEGTDSYSAARIINSDKQIYVGKTNAAELQLKRLLTSQFVHNKNGQR